MALRRGEFGIMDAHAPVYCMLRAAGRGPDIMKHRKPKALIPEDLSEGDKKAWLETPAE